uniref:Glomulin, FKBP associated protein n=1 Tax=Nothoprocta perdicaria TaxID=30464 RepID=A0A8C6YUX6_NOTPE
MAVDELQAIIQRCQILEEADFKGEDFNLFQVAGQKCLEDGYAAQLLEVVQNEKNKVIIKNMGWNLICPLVRCILMYKQEDDNREHCLKILDLLVQLCNAKELFLGLLEQIEQTSGEQVCKTVMLLLQPLQTVLFKLQNKKAYSVGLSLAVIMNQLTPLPVPYTKQQVQEDKLGLCQCCNAVVDFAKPFVSEVVKNMEKSSDCNDTELKEELLKFCMKSLKYPLLTAQLDQLESSDEHPFRHFCMPNQLYRSQSWENKEFADIEQKNSAESLACLSYLMFVHYFGIDYFPMVFSPSYLLQCNMAHIEELFESVLLRMEDNSLLHQYLELSNFITVPQRKKSLNILQLFINKFDAEGKYTLFRIMASLNLLRYLMIKDGEYDNQTGVWTMLAKIEQNFLKPLRVGLNMSKAHYEAEIKNKKENRRGCSNTVCSVTVSGEKLPAMTTEMQLQVLRSALFTFDLIESVLARVEELIEMKIKAREENYYH